MRCDTHTHRRVPAVRRSCEEGRKSAGGCRRRVPEATPCPEFRGHAGASPCVRCLCVYGLSGFGRVYMAKNLKGKVRHACRHLSPPSCHYVHTHTHTHLCERTRLTGIRWCWGSGSCGGEEDEAHKSARPVPQPERNLLPQEGGSRQHRALYFVLRHHGRAVDCNRIHGGRHALSGTQTPLVLDNATIIAARTQRATSTGTLTNTRHSTCRQLRASSSRKSRSRSWPRR